MKNFSLSTLFIPLAAALAIYFPLSSVSPTSDPTLSPPNSKSEVSQSSSKPPAKNSQSELLAGEGARLLCDFFGSYQNAAGNQPGGPDGFPLRISPSGIKGDYCSLTNTVRKTRDSMDKSGLKDTSLNLDFLLATIADPKDSQLDHLFDRNLDAIQNAVGAAGYVLDRYYLPWDKNKPAAPGTTTTATASGGTLTVTNNPAQTTPAAARHTYEPGVLVFRKTDDGISLLMVFLVGETPTFGIHKLAFQNALAQIEQLSVLAAPRSLADNPCPSFKEPYLRILGPTFSGSATPLALSLRSWFDREPPPPNALSKACLISGTATTINKDLFVQRAGGKDRVEFFSTTIPDSAARDAFIQHLVNEKSSLTFGGKSLIRLPRGRSEDGDRVHIAMLSEAGTSYGQSVRRPTPTPTPKPNATPTPTPPPNATPTPTPLPTPRILSLTYPLHISQLRVEAAKVKTGRADLPNGPSLKDGNLALPMSSEQSPKDIVPTFSTMEVVTSELMLSDVLSAIHRERVRYVGIAASDVLDRIFLIREIREHCPNAVVFTFTSDLIYHHSDTNLDAQGVWVITPYPLFAQNQFWTFPFEGGKARRQFTTNAAHGVYNATLALLGEPNLLLEYGYPHQAYNVGDSRKPALWLGIVGRNGIWPVKKLDYDDNNNYVWPAKVLPPKPELANEPKLEPQTGLIQNSQSVFSISFLLVIGILCLVPSLVLLPQLLLFSIERDNKSSEPADGPANAVKPNVVRRATSRFLKTIRKLLGMLGLLRLARRFKRGRIGQIFGDEEFYRYRFVRRINLMACCTSLLIISLFAAGVSILPKQIGVQLPTFSADWWQHQVITALAYATLIWVFVAFAWLFGSIFLWVIGNRRHLIGAEHAAISLGTGLLMIGLAVLGLSEIFFYEPLDRYKTVLFFLRATEITNGVSLLTPVAFIGLASFMTFYSTVRRINLSERMACLPEPQQKINEVPAFLRFDHKHAKSFAGVSSLESRLRELIVGRGFSTQAAVFVTATLFVVYGMIFLMAYTPSVDGWRFDLFFIAVFCLVPLLLICAFLRFVRMWIEMRRLLRRLSWHPLFADFAAAHYEEKRFGILPTLDPLSPPPTYTALSLSVQQARRFYILLKLPADKLAEVRLLVEEAEQKLAQSMQFEAQNNWQEAMLRRRDCEAQMAGLSEHISTLLECARESVPNSVPNRDTPGKSDWQSEGKFFMVMHIAAFLQHVFAHLQNLVVSVTSGLLLMLLASNSYPFQPRQPLLLFSWVTILTVVVVTLIIFVQMSRDKVLSLLSGTTPGKLNVTRDFMVRVLIHGVVPIVALLGAQFPETLRQIFSWLSAFQGGGR